MRLERIDGAGVDRAGAGDDADRTQTGAARSAVDLLRRSAVDVHPEVGVDRHAAQVVGAEAEDLDGLLNARVALRRGVDDHRRPRAPQAAGAVEAAASSRGASRPSPTSVATLPPLVRTAPASPAGAPRCLQPAERRRARCRCRHDRRRPRSESRPAASSSAITPSGAGGELTHAKKRGLALPIGWREHDALDRRRAARRVDGRGRGSGRAIQSRRCASGTGVRTGRVADGGQPLGEQVDRAVRRAGGTPRA